MNLGSLVPWRDKTQVDASPETYSDPFVSFRREVDRMFDDFFSATSRGGMQPWHAGWQLLSPQIDISDADKELVVTAEMPGLDEKDFEVTLAGDLLTIKGEKKIENEDRNGNAYYVERRYGSFSRSVRLPFEVGEQNVEANYDKGVLTVHVPKPPEAQRQVRRIEVKAM
jgi:HSP20 family protein